MKGVWHFYSLSYTDISRDTCWEAFHVLYNISKHNFDLWKGKRNIAVDESENNDTTPIVQPKWVISNNEQNLADAYMNCILLPIGRSNDHDFIDPFQRTGYLFGHGHLQILSCFMNFMLSATSLPASYKWFYKMLSDDIANLMMPIMCKGEELEDLQRRIIETICMHEALFPFNEAMFPYHQIIDIVHHLEEFGPIKGSWSLFGERAISRMKSYVPQGGHSYDSTVMHQYMLYEQNEMELFYNPESNKQEDIYLSYDTSCSDETGEKCCITYIPFPCKFHQVEHDKTRNIKLFDLENILECLLLDIESLHDNEYECIVHSTLYGLLYYYKRHIARNIENSTMPRFIRWLQDIKSRNADIVKDPNLIIMDPFDTMDKNYIYQMLNDGYIINDLLQTATEVVELETVFFRKATLLGIPLRSRGFSCRETIDGNIRKKYGEQNITRLPVDPINDENILKDKWYDKDHYSSWCKLATPEAIDVDFLQRPQREVRYGEDQEIKELFAQVNSYIAVYVPSDPCILRSVIASVTCRNAIEDIFGNYKIPSEDQQSYNELRHYVSISNILPTSIAVCGMYKNRKDEFIPVSIKQKRDVIHGNDCSFNHAPDIIELRMVLMDLPTVYSVYTYYKRKDVGYKKYDISFDSKEKESEYRCVLKLCG